MRFVKHIAAITAAVAITAGISSCGTHRGAVAETDDRQIPEYDLSRPPASGVNSDDARTAFRNLTAGYTDWKAIEVPFKVNIDKPARLSASGRAYMTRGRDIYLSIRLLGMEVANMYVTADSVFASEKLNRHYVAEPISSILADTGLTVNDLQDILLGRAFIPGSGTLNASDAGALSLTTADGMMLITPVRQPAGYEFGYLADIDSRSITNLVVEPAGLQPILCLYSDPLTVKGIGSVNNAITINATAAKTAVEASIGWRYDDARTTGVKSARWKMPKGYTRVTASQLLKMLNVNK